MKVNKVKVIVLAGIAAFIGIIAIQVYWLKQAFDDEEKKFSQNIQVSLLEVANEINNYYGYTAPHVNPVSKISKDYYIVNMRNDFDAKVLELLLVNKFRAKGINTNFEYAIYDCETEDMLYGSYVTLDKKEAAKSSTYFPKAQNLVYYFAVRFPEKASFIYNSLKGWIILCIVMIVTLFIYLYAIFIILQQQKYAALQKDFINNMTHEFKTPLASILIASNFLSRHDAISSNEKLKQYSNIIIEQGKKLDSHLEKILSVAKNDNNPLQLNKEPVDIAEAVNKTIDIIQLKYPEAVIMVSNSLDKATIEADAFHFYNVIYNFLDNSIKYCDDKPAIKIDLKSIGNAAEMKITDNGIGIAPRHLKHAFEKFYRAPESKKLAVNGFGLGLYYVKKICELHHWKLNAESTPGEGTVITLTMC
ncbi:MAG: HAMP domain-containing histidine kinase [Chitinophagaceae bacterium]|nr:HAMP domain-containing histidine kinase [Chitinophagaceae bacterium]